MPERVEDGHKWVGAARIDLPSTVVRQAHHRQTYRVRADTKVAIDEVYCNACRLTYERGVGRQCSATQSREARSHLSGGPVGDQRKRREDPGEPRAANM